MPPGAAGYFPTLYRIQRHLDYRIPPSICGRSRSFHQYLILAVLSHIYTSLRVFTHRWLHAFIHRWLPTFVHRLLRGCMHRWLRVCIYRWLRVCWVQKTYVIWCLVMQQLLIRCLVAPTGRFTVLNNKIETPIGGAAPATTVDQRQISGKSCGG